MRLPGRAAGTAWAELAGVFDGRAVWLAVPLSELGDDPSGWSYALRDESGASIPLGGEVDGTFLSAVADLPTTPGRYDVLVARDDDVRPVVADEPVPGPTRTPDVPPVRYRLERRGDGLQVVVTALKDAAYVVDLATDGTTISLTMTGAGDELVFVQDQVSLGSVPLSPGSRGVTASLTAGDVPGTNTRLEVTDGQRRRQVRRIRNGLSPAGPAVLLPRLEDDRGKPVLVCQWHPTSGNLRLRRPDLASATTSDGA